MTGTELKRTKAPPQYSAALQANGLFAVVHNWDPCNGEGPWAKYVFIFDHKPVLLGEWDRLEHAEAWARALCNSRPVDPEARP